MFQAAVKLTDGAAWKGVSCQALGGPEMLHGSSNPPGVGCRVPRHHIPFVHHLHRGHTVYLLLKLQGRNSTGVTAWRFLPTKRTPGDDGDRTVMFAVEEGKAVSNQEDTACPGGCGRGCPCLPQLLDGAWSAAGKTQRGSRILEGHPRVLPPLGTGYPTDTCQIAPPKQGWQQQGACTHPGGGGFTFLPC